MSIIVVSSDRVPPSPLVPMLNRAGYPSVLTFTSAAETLSYLGLRETRGLESSPAGVDLLILDVGTNPQELDLIRELKGAPQVADLPIVVISQSDQPELLPMAFAYGANDYMSHPVQEPELIARVRASLILKHEIDRRKAHEKELLEATRQLTDLNAWLSRLSVIDSLTKVANRRGFDTTIEQEWRRAVRNQTPLALILIDVDHFKAYNDTQGHREGDECLVQVAHALKSTVQRPGDTVARYGGEEFALILAETTGPGATYVAEQARAHVEALGIEHPASDTAPCVTVSVGLATLEPHLHGNPDELIRQADAALYQAKESGRNQVATRVTHDRNDRQMDAYGSWDSTGGVRLGAGIAPSRNASP